MELIPLSLNGAFLLKLYRQQDDRGLFFKPFHASSFLQKSGMAFEPKESICSASKKNVVRGMHFQTAPHGQAKLVYCPHGAILDVILDIRPGSKTFGKYEAVELSAQNGHSLYIPDGFAHGFLSLEDGSITSYLLDAEYHPQADTGILWNSFGFGWPIDNPILSARDLGFKTFKEWEFPL